MNKTSTSTRWWSMSAEDTLQELGSSTRGLTRQEAAQRLEQHGPNALEEEGGFSWFSVLVRQFASPLIYILIFAAIATLILGEYIDAGFIIGVVTFNAALGFFQEYRAEQSMAALRSLATSKAHVLRDDREEDVDATTLVPGDVIFIESGARVPADCRLIHAASLEVDESLLTGESTTVNKSASTLDEDTILAERANMLSMATIAVRGRGRAVVVATGKDTQLGQIAGSVQDVGRAEVPLLNRMNRFAKMLSFLVLAGGAVGFVAGIIAGQPAEDLFMHVVTLAVATVPEGLPIVLTITLAVGLNRMAKRNVIIRRLSAVETLGSCSVIGSDKTGTLTQNEMTVRGLLAAGERFDLSGTGYDVDGQFEQDGDPIEVEPGTPLHLLLLAGALCNDATLVEEEDGSAGTTGDPTEIALLVSAAKAGMWKDAINDEYERWAEIPFDPERRFAATFHKDPKAGNVVFVKGAPEQVLEMCGEALEGSDLDPEAVLAAAEEMAEEGLRVLAMAYHDGSHAEGPDEFLSNTSLTFLGLQGMIDPPRPEAQEAIRNCQDAGIRVLMITGDHATTGLAIAQQLGIAGVDDRVLTGRDIDAMSPSDLPEAAATTPVFARVSPEHKYRIVQALQSRGEVVAVTGDGVNDGPALRAANVGVAMGRSGTDVAKEASDVVVMDDNFASIFAGVDEGRVVFDNIRLVTFFLISSAAGLVLAVIASIFLGMELPFLPAQLLWQNLVTNGVQDIALAFEPGDKDRLKKKPRPMSEGIISRVVMERTILTGIVLAAGSLFMFKLTLDNGASIEEARTVALTTAVIFQIIHVGNCRSESRSIFAKTPWSNPYLLVGSVASLLIHIGAVYFGPAQAVLRFEALEVITWVQMFAIALSVIVVNEAHKWYRNRYPIEGGASLD